MNIVITRDFSSAVRIVCVLLILGAGCVLAANVMPGVPSGSGVQPKARGGGKGTNEVDEVFPGIEQRICRHLFSHGDLNYCEKMVRDVKDPAVRLKYQLLLARNLRVNKGDPVACIEMLGPAVVPGDRVAAWKKSRAAALESAMTKWRKDCADARQEKHDELPEKPKGILEPFVPIAEWDLQGPKVECAIEIIRAHMDLGEYPAAIAMVDAIGKKFEGVGRVLAAECAAELMAQMQSYAKAVKFYRFGLDVLHSLVSEGEGLSARQKAVEARLVAGLNEVSRQGELEQYGEGYILYRKAEQKRRGEGSFLEALLLYEDLCRQFPKTVYAEAAQAYSVDCLLALADGEAVSCAEAAILQAERAVKERNAGYLEMKRNKVGQGVLDAELAAVRAMEVWLERMRTAPVGAKAQKEAKKLAASFMAASPYGLYRGETMLRLGDYALEHEFKVKESLAWFEKGCDWFDKIKDLDAQVAALEVPSQAKVVSAPPPEMKCKDAWGNVEWSQLEIGKLFNRKTSAWYVPYHRMMGRTKRSLCYFIAGDSRKALEGLDIILQVDEKERAIYLSGMPNSYSRLKAEFEEGRMFATKEELKNFCGFARTALLVAEYYFELERWADAKRRYERINRTFRRHLSLSGCAYLDFMLGNCALMTGNKDKALEQYKKFESVYKNTPTWPRAMFNIFNIYQFIPETKMESLSYLRRVHKRMPDTDLGQRAYYHEGEFWYSNGNPEKAKLIFMDCLKKYKGTWLAKGSGQYLEKIEKAEQKDVSERSR